MVVKYTFQGTVERYKCYSLNVSVDVAVMNVAENLQFVTKLGFQNIIKRSQTFTNTVVSFPPYNAQ